MKFPGPEHVVLLVVEVGSEVVLGDAEAVLVELSTSVLIWVDSFVELSVIVLLWVDELKVVLSETVVASSVVSSLVDNNKVVSVLEGVSFVMGESVTVLTVDEEAIWNKQIYIFHWAKLNSNTAFCHLPAQEELSSDVHFKITGSNTDTPGQF